MNARWSLRCGFLLSVMALGATPAPAQLPGLLKKKLQAVGAEATPPTPPQYDDVTLELTPERLDKVLAGLKAGAQIARGPLGPAALQTRREKRQSEREKLGEKHDPAWNAWDEQRREVEQCRDDGFAEARDRRALQHQGSQEVMKIAMEVAQANVKGDTAEAQRLLEKLRLLREPTAADSAAVDRNCGKLPVPPPEVMRMITLDQQIRALDDSIRQAEAEVDRAELEASGMNERQFPVAVERILNWLGAREHQSRPAGYSAGELGALEERVAELKKYAR